MLKSKVFEYYRDHGKAGVHGGVLAPIANDLNVTPQYVSCWPDLVPKGMAAQLHIVNDGELRFDPEQYR